MFKGTEKYHSKLFWLWFDLLIASLILFIYSCSQAKTKSETNSPKSIENWGLTHTHSQSAWSKTTGDQKVIVAIIDTGIDLKHPSLKSNLWTNTGETGKDSNGLDKSSNGIDDDRNGFIDDVHGWNFAGNTPNVQDTNGHGTHIAGIIGASNKEHPIGVAPKVSLMILKYYGSSATGFTNLRNSIRSIKYATKMGAHIINYSGGGTNPSPGEKAAIRKALEKNILFVAAAGNEGQNSDRIGYYPAAYSLPNIVSVAAIDQSGEILPFSNYGVQNVDIAAPGHKIMSTLHRNNYGPMTGTSQATAFVTGAAALIKASQPDLKDPKRILRQLIQTGDYDDKLKSKTKYELKLNALKAVTAKDIGTSGNGLNVKNRSHHIRGLSQRARGQNLGRLSEPIVQLVQTLKSAGNINSQLRMPSSDSVSNTNSIK